MGRRRALIYRAYRQSWLAHNIASRQLLTARVARHQRLFQVLGFSGLTTETSQRTIMPPQRSLASPWQRPLPPTRPVFRPSLIEQAKAEREVALVQDELERVSSLQEAPVQRANQFLAVQGQEESMRENQPTEPSRIEALEVQDRLHLPEQQSAEKRAASDSEPEVHQVESDVAQRLPEISEPVEVEFQQEQKGTETPAQPEERASIKRPRGRIEEHPAEMRPVLASSLISSAPSLHSADQATKALERSVIDVAAKSNEEIAADDLFAPRDTDRSPQAWITRLFGTRSSTHEDVASPHQDQQIVMVPSADAGSRSSQILAEPGQAESGQPGAGSKRFIPGRVGDISQVRVLSTPLTQRTRRFLQPLVGIDLTGVRVHRDAIADRLTDLYQADALTIGDDVELAVGHPDDSPETLGLLAHEFTHVARQRDSHFIPPVARSLNPMPSRASQSSLLDEETLALLVESQVNRETQKRQDQLASMPDEPVDIPTQTIPPVTISRTARDVWGGLPAPWEPLPDWFMTMPARAESSEQPRFVGPQPAQTAYGTVGMSGTSKAPDSGGRGTDLLSGDTGVQRAGRERNPDGEEEQKVSHQPEAAKAPEPNLDELARQVYAILKRRLGVEYRRER